MSRLMAGKGNGKRTRSKRIQQRQRADEALNEEDQEVNSVGRTTSEQREGSVRTGSSTASAVIIAQLREQLREKDEALKAAGLGGNSERTNRVNADSEGESRATLPKVERVVERVVREHEGETFKTFISCKPPSFKGGDDPLVCMRWVRKMEQVYDSGNFSEKQKVSYAIRMLEGEALDWWDALNQSLSTEVRELLTWGKFVERLNTRFCSSGAIQRFERDFTNLVKGGMSIGKYNTTFIEKLQFARHMCPTEMSLVNKYVEGLPFEYRGHVRNKSMLDAAMEEARRVEDDLALQEKSLGVGEKRKFDSSAGSSQKKPKSDDGEGRKKGADYCRFCRSSHQGQCGKDTVKCNKCGKMGHYANECKEKGVVCYNCNEVGHISTQCTKPKGANARAGKRIEIGAPTARAFNMNAEEERQDD